MIRLAEDKDHMQLKTLWNQVFGDSSAAIDFYFSNRHQNQNMLVYEENKVVAGMLTMLPVQFVFGKQMHPGRYIYAVATAPAYRQRGISTQLLLNCHSYMQKKGETAAILSPASESLFAFYEKRGYQTVFYVESSTFLSSGLPPCRPGAICTPCLTEDYFRIRDTAFSDSSLFVRWGEDALEYIIKAARAFGDDVYYIRTQKGEGCAVCGWRSRKIFIREIALVNIGIPDALSILHRTLGADEYILRLPIGSLQGSTPQPFGMIHYLCDVPESTGKPPYLSLILD